MKKLVVCIGVLMSLFLTGCDDKEPTLVDEKSDLDVILEELDIRGGLMTDEEIESVASLMSEYLLDDTIFYYDIDGENEGEYLFTDFVFNRTECCTDIEDCTANWCMHEYRTNVFSLEELELQRELTEYFYVFLNQDDYSQLFVDGDNRYLLYALSDSEFMYRVEDEGEVYYINFDVESNSVYHHSDSFKDYHELEEELLKQDSYDVEVSKYGGVYVASYEEPVTYRYEWLSGSEDRYYRKNSVMFGIYDYNLNARFTFFVDSEGMKAKPILSLEYKKGKDSGVMKYEFQNDFSGTFSEMMELIDRDKGNIIDLDRNMIELIFDHMNDYDMVLDEFHIFVPTNPIYEEMVDVDDLVVMYADEIEETVLFSDHTGNKTMYKLDGEVIRTIEEGYNNYGDIDVVVTHDYYHGNEIEKIVFYLKPGVVVEEIYERTTHEKNYYSDVNYFAHGVVSEKRESTFDSLGSVTLIEKFYIDGMIKFKESSKMFYTDSGIESERITVRYDTEGVITFYEKEVDANGVTTFYDIDGNEIIKD